RSSPRCTAPWASTRPGRSPTAAAARCTSSTTASRSANCCTIPPPRRPVLRPEDGALLPSIRSRPEVTAMDTPPPNDHGIADLPANPVASEVFVAELDHLTNDLRREDAPVGRNVNNKWMVVLIASSILGLFLILSGGGLT